MKVDGLSIGPIEDLLEAMAPILRPEHTEIPTGGRMATCEDQVGVVRILREPHEVVTTLTKLIQVPSITAVFEDEEPIVCREEESLAVTVESNPVMTVRTMTAAATASAMMRPAEPGLRDTLASEWVKLTTLRSTYVMLGLVVALSIATTALASLAMGSTRDEWPADFDPMTFSMVGNVFALIIYSVFGVLVLTREYSSGMMRLTLSASPRRWRVLIAKLSLVTGIILILGIATTTGMSLVAQAILGAYGLPVAGLGDADQIRLVLGLGLVMPFFPVVGVALGVLLRSTAGAITTVLGLLWLPVILGEMVPLWWQQNVISYLPGTALDSFTIAHVFDSPTHLDPAAGAVVATAWLIAVIGAAAITFTRRDA